MSFLNLHQPENNHTSSSPSLFLPSVHNTDHRVFSCSYCSRKFYSPQAFGGHQNAHRLERTLARRSRELTSVARHPPEWNCDSSRCAFDTNGSTHVGRVQPPVVVGVQDQELSAGSHEMGINIDCGYKGASVEDGFNHLDLSLRL
ncbi:hypothetical protein R6Q57_020416 [Mikania cordata]